MNKKLCMMLLSGIMLFSVIAMMPATAAPAGEVDVVKDSASPRATGSLSANGDTEMWTFEVTAGTESMQWVLTCGSADFDLYGRLGSAPTTSTYDWRGYTSGGEDVTTTNPGVGTWYIMVRAYSGAPSSYELNVYITGGSTPPPVDEGDMGLGAGFDAYDSYGASDSATLLTAPISGTGTIDLSTDQYDQYRVAVDAGDEVTVVYSGPGSGMDVPIYDTTKTAFETISNTNGFTRTVTASGNGYVYITIDADASDDTGVYSLDISVSGGVPADTTAPTVSISSPTNGATVSGSITVNVASSDNVGVVGEAISLDGGSYTTNMVIDTTVLSNAEHTIRARAWDEAGNYGYSSTIAVEVDNYVPPPPPPQDWVLVDEVTENGNLATSSDTNTWTIVVAADCESMYTVMTCGSADFDLYGRLGAAPTTSTYDWRGYTGGGEEVTQANPGAGTWYIMVNVYSGAPSDYTLNCDLTYGVAPPPPPPPTDDGGELTDGVAANGHMDQTDGADMWYITVDANAESMSVILTCGSADFDTYGRAGSEPTTSTYDWRGYTSGGEENTVANPAQGTYYIMVDYYSGDSDYVLTVTITYGGTPPPPPPPGGDKYALIVGISDYKAISDLSYCDEDATDWFNYLISIGYSADNIIVLGDGHSSNYPKYNGLATEANYKYYLNWLADQDCDTIGFYTSGHGAGDGNGNSYLCAWDCGSGESGEDGDFNDYEVAAILATALADNIHVFIDHCYSGGMAPELMAMGNSAKVYCSTTCTEDGYGYDDPTHNNGAWTYYFLEYTLINHFGSSATTTMEAAYDYAAAAYPHSGGDACMEFDGNTGSYFYL